MNFTFFLSYTKIDQIINITILYKMNKLGHTRIGMTIDKKKVNFSHKRNRIKRMIRESGSFHKNYLPVIDCVVVSKKWRTYLDNGTLRKSLERLWNRYYWN